MGVDLQQLAQIATILSTIIVALGWVNEYFKRKREKRIVKSNIWSNISIVKGIMNNIEKSLDTEPNSKEGNKTQNACIGAHGLLAALLRELFREAIVNEEDFKYETILKWRAIGKISSDWQQRLVMTLLDTTNISEKEIKEIPKDYSNWDSLPKNHPCYSPHPEEDKEKE